MENAGKFSLDLVLDTVGTGGFFFWRVFRNLDVHAKVTSTDFRRHMALNSELL
jgi:hypothetical protein